MGSVNDVGWRIRSSELSWREVNGAIIALDLASSSYFSTNASGSLMWKALVGGASPDELQALLLSNYQITPSQATGDVAAFIDLLAEHKLLEPIGPDDRTPTHDH